MSEKKSGIKTTEFWGMIISVLGFVVTAFIGKLDPNTLAIVSSVVTGLYIIARTIVKLTPSQDDDKLLDEIAAKILSRIPNKNDTK